MERIIAYFSICSISSYLIHLRVNSSMYRVETLYIERHEFSLDKKSYAIRNKLQKNPYPHSFLSSQNKLALFLPSALVSSARLFESVVKVKGGNKPYVY